MNRQEIETALKAVGRRLSEQNLQGDMYLVGGAAIAMAFDSRRSTKDVDAAFEPKMAIYAAAAEVARELNLPLGWLNDAVKGFLSGSDPEAAPVLDVPGLRCMAASPKILLALKVLAHRAGEDEDDVRLLAGKLSLSSSEEVLDLAASVFGHRLDPAAEFFVEQIFQA